MLQHDVSTPRPYSRLHLLSGTKAVAQKYPGPERIAFGHSWIKKEELEELYKKYSNDLVIVGFPANNFGGQEPGSNTEISSFCKKNYGVTFPMAEKVSVKGEDIHPLFKYLVAEAEKLGEKDPIKWNFTKFLLDENGKLVKVFHNKVLPMSEEVVSAIAKK